MNAPRIALGLALALIAGCGGNPPEIDTAETIRTEPPKPAQAPAPETTPPATPEATPAKDAPKG